MQFHIEFDIAAIAIIIVCYLYTHFSFDGTKISTRQYKFMMIVVLIATILDSVTSYTLSLTSRIPMWVNYIGCSIYYFSAAASAYMLPRYVRYLLPVEKRMKMMDQINRCILIIYFLICISNTFTHAIFYIDENYHYEHGSIYLIVYILPIYFICISASRGIFFKSYLSNKQFFAIVTFTFLGIVVMLLQFFLFQDYLLTYFGSALGMFIILYSLETPDYDKLKATMLELQKSREEALLANQAKSTFLASMSHEIRTPINGILGMNEIALNENKDPQIEEYLFNIQNAGQSLLSLINDILDISKIESGKLEIHPREYLLSDVLYSISNLLSPKATEKGLNLIIENAPAIPNKLFGDDTRIRQVIINILNNGIKYTEKGFVKLTLDFSMIDDDQLTLLIKVTDSGIGISKEDLPKLFNSYQRVDEDKNRNIEGTGLGLSITKQLTELMNGSIFVTSEYGQGSEFTINIPQKIIENIPIGDYKAKALSGDTKSTSGSALIAKIHAPSATILVVDDNELNRKVIYGLLKNTQIQMELVDSGKACLEMAANKVYDMILLDHMMPEMDGIETLKHLQADPESLNRNTPIVVLTANAIAGAKEEYLSYGFCDFLAKPVDTKLLYNVLVKYIPPTKLNEPADTNTQNPEPKEPNPLVKKLSAVLDTASGLQNCAGQNNLYTDLVNEFVNETYDKTLIDCFFKLDWKTYGTISHGIKSATRTIGANDFSLFAKRMEDACKEDRVDIILANHDNFINEFKALQDKLRELL